MADKPPFDVLEMLTSGEIVKICAPMVRYSKLPFRLTVREYGTDVCYTPMIMADSFINSQIARDLEFQRCLKDGPTVIQFAASSAHEFANATQLVAPFVEGVDLNCGCPQTWAIDEGIGASLMRNPELIRDMVLQARNRAGITPVSVKMRMFEEERRTVELARMIEAAGTAWITLHGRTRKQKSSEPVNYEMIKLVKESISIPLVANGDITSLSGAKSVVEHTKVNGVMTARGLLENPALFSGAESTPWECVDKFILNSIQYGTNSPIFHHHLAKMTFTILTPVDFRILNSLSNASVPTILEFFKDIRVNY